jgi:ABC-type phosphate transport system substrate-binding protein
MLTALCLLWCSCLASVNATDTDTTLAVVVHLDNTTRLDQQQLIQLYLNKISSFQNGQTARVLHLPRSSAQHRQFCLQMLNLSASQYQSYWSRMLFTGAASDMIFIDNSEQLLKLLQTDKTAVGYLPANEAQGVRVIGYLQQGQWQAVDTQTHQ